MAVAAESAGAAAVLVVWPWVQIIQRGLCDVQDTVFRENARRNQSRRVHRAPLSLSSFHIQLVCSEDNRPRVGTYKAVALSRMALPCRDRASVAPLGVGALRVQEAADGGLLLVLDGAVG